MPNTRLNPPSLYESTGFGFSHATVQDGGRTIHLAGQVAWDKDCNVVGPGDLAAQTRQALANLKAVLEAAGATPADVVRVHRRNQSDVAIGIEAPYEFVAVEIQVALHRVLAILRKRTYLGLPASTKTLV